jgi:O-antigen/teichoic acid export membrane protein
VPETGPRPSGRRRSVGFNFSITAVAVGCQKALNFLTTIVIARTFVVSDYGAFTAAMAFAYVVVTVADLGLMTHTWLEIARADGRTRLYFTYGAVAKALLAPLVYASMVVMAGAVHLPVRSVGLMPLVAGAYLCWSAVELTFAVYRAHEQMHLEALIGVLYQVGLLVSAVAVRILGAGLNTLALASTACAAATLLTSLAIVHRRFGGLARFARPVPMARWLTRSLPFAVYAGVTTLCFRADVVVVAIAGGAAVGGLYAAASTVPTAGVAVLQSFLQASFAGLARHSDDPVEFGRLARRTLRLALLWGLVAGAVTWLAVGLVLEAAFGSRFSGLARMLGVMALAFPASFVGLGLLYVLNSARLVRYVSAGIGTAAVAGAGTNLLLVPRHGALGAAVAYVVTQLVFVATLGAAYVRRFDVRTFPFAPFAGMVAAMTAAAAVSLLVRQPVTRAALTLLPAAALGAIAWTAVLEPGERRQVRAAPARLLAILGVSLRRARGG